MAIVSYHGSMTAWIPSCIPISDTLFYVLASEPCVSFFVVCRLVIIDLLVIQDSNVPYNISLPKKNVPLSDICCI